MTNEKKGFTFAELLIVVAIIGVLVAVSIPIFTAQLEKSRESVDMANLRDAYAVCSAAALTLDDSSNAPAKTSKIEYTFPAAADAKGKDAVWTAKVTATQTQEGWQSTGGGDDIGGKTGIVAVTSADTWTVSVKADGTVNIDKTT